MAAVYNSIYKTSDVYSRYRSYYNDSCRYYTCGSHMKHKSAGAYLKNCKCRSCQGQNMRLRIVLASVIFIVLALVFFTSVSYAEGNVTQSGRYKYYREHHIQYGDTLEKIADSFIESGYSSKVEFEREIRQINDLNSSKWTDLSVVLVPYYSDEYK